MANDWAKHPDKLLRIVSWGLFAAVVVYVGVSVGLSSVPSEADRVAAAIAGEIERGELDKWHRLPDEREGDFYWREWQDLPVAVEVDRLIDDGRLDTGMFQLAPGGLLFVVQEGTN